MTTEQALLAAVWASPHDDLPRLVYADWCDENGRGERAEFIRVQCELARMDDESSERWKELVSIELRLWMRYRHEFSRGLSGKIVNDPFRRGFVAPRRRMLVLDHFLNWSEEQLNRAPLWEFHVNFRPPARIVELTRSPRFRRLAFLGLWTMSDKQAVAVADSPHVVNLSGLHCRHGVMTADGVRAITRSPHLPHLNELILEVPVVDVALATALIDSPLAERLKRLELKKCDRIDLDARVLLAERFTRRLISGEFLV